MDDPSSYGYLKKACLNQADADIDLSDETAFSKYIKSSADGYDSDIRYYRWFATADLSDKTETVNEILAARHSISPKMCYIMNLTVRRRWMSPLPGRKWEPLPECQWKQEAVPVRFLH